MSFPRLVPICFWYFFFFYGFRQSCLRSLSCEVCPEREGPIFYGSDVQGYTISHTFVLKDSKARGFQHWYSLIVVSVDKLLLLNSYNFIVKSLKSIIEELQWKAMRVYESEQVVVSEKTLRREKEQYQRNFQAICQSALILG